MTEHYSLQNKVALVTGASRGIGLAIAQEFISLGAKVAVTGRYMKNLHIAKKELGESCRIYQSDITRKSEHSPLVCDIEAELGSLDILVNNAGLHCKKVSTECSDEEFHAVLDTNLHSVFSLIRTVLGGMLEREGGSIISIASVSAIFGLPEVSAYSSSKSALLGLSRSLAVEYSGSGVRFNCLAPGFIESQMLREIINCDPVREQKILGRTPMKRLGKPEEVAYAASFLASDASRFVTGVCLPVDGGAAIGF